jgi:hypothetical protein
LTVRTKIAWPIGCTAAALILIGSPAEAQQPPPAQPAPEVELSSLREVFEYPTFPRRNPFSALTSGTGPRYEQLTLTGIIWDPDPTFSVAVVTTGAVSITPEGVVTVGVGDAYNAKVGQRIGNTTIREIQRDRVVVDVEEFGLTERRTMFIASRRQGGTQ